MKKKLFISTIYGILFINLTFGQNLKPVAQMVFNQKPFVNSAFRSVNLFNLENTPSYALNNTLTSVGINNKVTLLNLNATEISRLVQQPRNTMQLSIPQNNDSVLVLEMIRVNIFAPNFKVVTSSGDTLVPSENDRGIQYHGIIKGDSNSIVAISIFKDEITGLITTSKGNKVIGKIKGQSTHILYDDNLLPQPAFSCNTADTPFTNLPTTKNNRPQNQYCDLIPVRIDCDYETFVNIGNSNDSQTRNYAINLFNQVSLLYRNEDLAVVIGEIHVWNTPDPYNGYNNADALTDALVATIGSNFGQTINHLLTTKSRVGAGGQAAGIDGLTYKPHAHSWSNIDSYYDSFPIYSWSVSVVTHELGHNLGSRHTHACVWNGNNTAIDNCGATSGGCPPGAAPTSGGTIMSYCHNPSVYTGILYGINFANGFGPQPGNVIRNNVATNNPIWGIVTPPTNLIATQLGNGSVELSWTPNASVNFQLEWGTTIYPPSKATTKIITGLTPGQTYSFRVFGECGGWSSYASFTVDGLALDPTINTVCRGTTIDLSYTTFGNYSFQSNNVFSVTLTQNGYYAVIGSITSTNPSGVINCKIPDDLINNGQYSIGVESSNTYLKSITWGIDIGACCFQGQLQWQKTIGGSLDDNATSAIQTSDGNYLVIGNSNSTTGDITGNKGANDVWLAKLDPQKNIIWQKNYGGTGDDYAYSVIETTDGYVFAGSTNSNDGDAPNQRGLSDIWVVKIHKNTANILWQRRIGSSLADEVYNLTKATDGFLITGIVGTNNFDLSNENSDGNLYVGKLNELGEIIWQHTFGGDASEFGKSITLGSDGSIYVVGTSYSNSPTSKGAGDIYLLKLNSFGEKLWDKYLGGTNKDVGTGITTSLDGGIVICGESASSDGDATPTGVNLNGHRGFLAIKLDANGYITWVKLWGGVYDNYSPIIITTTDGGFLLGGTTTQTGEFGNSPKSYYMIKLGPTGYEKWHKLIPAGMQNSRLNSLIQLNDNGFLLAGTEFETSGEITINKGGSDYWLVKLVPDVHISKPNNKTYVCQGESVTLTMSNCNGSIVWNNGSTNKTITTTVSNPYESFYATCSQPNCTNYLFYEDFDFDFHPTPSAPSITSNQNLTACTGSNVTLFSSCVGTTNWSTGITANSITVNPTNTSSYSANCNVCSNTSPNGNITIHTVTQPTTPSLSQEGLQTICPSTTLFLSASNCNGSLLWSNGSNKTGISISSIGTYTASCLNSCGTKQANSQFIVALPSISTTLSDIALNGNTKAIQTISSTQNINNGINSSYSAGRSITLNPNFIANKGAVFKAEIGTCAITAGLVAYYNMNNNVDDQSGNGHHTTYTNTTVTTGRKGNANGAYSFNGVNQRINLGGWFNLQEFTISMWLNAATTQNNSYAMIFDNNHGFNISFNVQQDFNNTNQYYFGVGGTPTYGYSGFSLTPNQWEHIVLVKGNGFIKVYKNGVILGSATHSGLIDYTSTVPSLCLGAYVNNNNYIRYWAGKMDDIKIYNRAVSDVEVSYLYSE